MKSMKNTLTRLALLVGLALTFMACGTPTVEYQLTRFQKAMDSLDILAAKQPQLRMDIDRKKLEFATEFEKVRGLQGEDGSKTIGALCSRVEQYHSQLNPQPVQPAGTTQPGSKLGATPAQPMGGQPAVPAGGKLGATPGAAPGAPGAVPTDSGFGGGAAPAPGTVPAPAPGAAPQGGSGFGGAAPAPGTVPAPAPGTQPAGGGFGGQ
jgi:hypothetical protein